MKFYKNQYNKKTGIELFWEKVDKKNKNKCWEWIGAMRTTGYGCLRRGDKIVGAHRFSWELHFDKITKGLYVLHKCDNRKCVNPNHLLLGTCKDNVSDAIKKKRVPQLTGNNHKTKKHKIL